MIPTSIDSRKITNRRLAYSDDLSTFKCDLDDELGCDDFIHKEIEAKLYQKEKHGVTYIFFYETTMIGYVTLAMSSILAKRIEKRQKGQVPLTSYPSLLVGRLAVHNEWRDKGVGEYLCNWCVGVALDISERIGCRYVILQTHEGKRVDYYAKRGFQKGQELEDKHEKLVWMYQKITPE